MIVRNRQYHRSDARNTVWVMAAFPAIMMIVIIYVLAVGGGRHVTWDALTISVTGYVCLLFGASITAGILCGRGKTSGRILANIIAFFFFFKFPIGTAIAIWVWVKVNSEGFVNALERDNGRI